MGISVRMHFLLVVLAIPLFYQGPSSVLGEGLSTEIGTGATTHEASGLTTEQVITQEADGNPPEGWIRPPSRCHRECWFNPHPTRNRCMMRRRYGRGPCIHG